MSGRNQQKPKNLFTEVTGILCMWRKYETSISPGRINTFIWIQVYTYEKSSLTIYIDLKSNRVTKYKHFKA